MFPIKGFEKSKNGELFICTYGGEVTPVRSKNIIFKGTPKKQLLNINFNMNYVSRNSAERFINATIFFSVFKDKIIVESIDNEKTQEFVYVAYFDKTSFENIDGSIKYLSDTYMIHNSNKYVE